MAINALKIKENRLEQIWVRSDCTGSPIGRSSGANGRSGSKSGNGSAEDR